MLFRSGSWPKTELNVRLGLFARWVAQKTPAWSAPAEFAELATSFAEHEPAQPAEVANSDKPLKTTERDSLLILIATLLKQNKIDLAQKGVVKLVALTTEEFGNPLSEDTVSRILKQIPGALTRRGG